MALVCAVLFEKGDKRELVDFVLSHNPALLEERRNGKTAREVAVEEEYADIMKQLDSRA